MSARTLAQPQRDEVVWYQPPPGFEFHWARERDTDWRLATEQERARRCRRPGCRRQPIAALMRTRLSRWGGDSRTPWLYCDWHLYGRRIIDGKFYVRRLRRIEE